MMKTVVTTKWATVAIVGYSGSVSRNENRSAHGGVCLLQVRKNKDRVRLGRKVNSNGKHKEIGEVFLVSEERLAQWEQIAKASR
jgi:hypothetical protein